jgi:ABC-type glycerol-3-phosphate transport system substrate-binding protein
MKRNIFLFALILTMGLTACGNESTTSNETTDSTATGADTTVVADSAASQETVDSTVKQ